MWVPLLYAERWMERRTELTTLKSTLSQIFFWQRLKSIYVFSTQCIEVCPTPCSRLRLKPDGTRWRTGEEVKGKLAIGVGSQYSHTTSERGVSSITKADVHTSAASSLLNWRPSRLKWTLPFLRKKKFGFCACVITFQTHYNIFNELFTNTAIVYLTTIINQQHL